MSRIVWRVLFDSTIISNDVGFWTKRPGFKRPKFEWDDFGLKQMQSIFGMTSFAKINFIYFFSGFTSDVLKIKV